MAEGDPEIGRRLPVLAFAGDVRLADRASPSTVEILGPPNQLMRSIWVVFPRTTADVTAP